MASSTVPGVDAVYGPETERFYRDGSWHRGLLIDQLHDWAAAEPDAPYLYEGELTVTVGELHARSLDLARRLSSRGLGRGDRVAAQLPNWHELAIVFLAVQRLGAILVPIMPIYRDHEARHILATSGARALVVAHRYRGFDYRQMILRLRAELPDLEHVIYARPDGPLAHGDMRLDGGPESVTAATELPDPPSPDEPALILFTSGTEAGAKGCLHTWNTFAYSCRGIAEECDFRAGDVELVVSPITHTTGLIGALKPLMYRGRVCLMESWDPEVALELIRRRGCTQVMAATVFAQTLLDTYDPARHDAGSLRYFLCGGAPVPERLVARFSAVLGRSRMLTMYGQSEFVNGALTRPGDSPARVASSDGSPLPAVTLRIVTADGRPQPPDTEGEIEYRGPGGMLGYWGDPEATARVLRSDGWRRTGDRGHLDRDGYLRVTGRTKELVIRGGMNISILEIEELIRTHPAVLDVAVLGVPDERLGERLAAAVVTRDDLGADDLLRYLADDRRLARQKLPEVIRFLPDLPRTATGKVQRYRILQALQLDAERV